MFKQLGVVEDRKKLLIDLREAEGGEDADPVAMTCRGQKKTNIPGSPCRYTIPIQVVRVHN